MRLISKKTNKHVFDMSKFFDIRFEAPNFCPKIYIVKPNLSTLCFLFRELHIMTRSFVHWLNANFAINPFPVNKFEYASGVVFIKEIELYKISWAARSFFTISWMYHFIVSFFTPVRFRFTATFYHNYCYTSYF